MNDEACGGVESSQPSRLQSPRRDFLFLHCQAGHEWVFEGGRSCNCGHTLGHCSLPVHRCAKCGDYDYGDNAEADEIMARCAEEDADNEESRHG